MACYNHIPTSAISDFKAHLLERLHDFRAGARLLIIDRDHSISVVRPVEASFAMSGLREARRSFAIPTPPAWSMKIDAMLLLEGEGGTR